MLIRFWLLHSWRSGVVAESDTHAHTNSAQRYKSLFKEISKDFDYTSFASFRWDFFVVLWIKYTNIQDYAFGTFFHRTKMSVIFDAFKIVHGCRMIFIECRSVQTKTNSWSQRVVELLIHSLWHDSMLCDINIEVIKFSLICSIAFEFLKITMIFW